MRTDPESPAPCSLQTLSRAEIAATLRRHTLLEQLSERELEVLRRLARGETQRSIGPAMCWAPRTIRVAVARLEEVLGAVNPTNAVALAYEAGVLNVGDARCGGPAEPVTLTRGHA